MNIIDMPRFQALVLIIWFCVTTISLFNFDLLTMWMKVSTININQMLILIDSKKFMLSKSFLN